MSVFVDFKVNKSLYADILKSASRVGTYAVAEQLLTDSNEYVKYDSGIMRDTGRVTQEDNDAVVSMDTPYALRQYYTGKGIKKGKGNPPASPWEPSVMWFHKTYTKYKKDYSEIMQKAAAMEMNRR